MVSATAFYMERFPAMNLEGALGGAGVGVQGFPEQVLPGSWVDALAGWRGPWRGLELGVRTQSAWARAAWGKR